MNLEKLDNKTMTMIVVACTCVVLGVLIIDMQIAKNLAENAQLIISLRRKDQDEVTRSNGSFPRATVNRYHGSDSLDGNSGMETRANFENGEEPLEGWDAFHVDRTETHRAPGSRNLAIPEERGTVES